MVRLRSAGKPFDEPELATSALRVVRTADAMGVLPERDDAALDLPFLRDAVIEPLRRAGIGAAGGASFSVDAARSKAELKHSLDALWRALEECPLPDHEWQRLTALFDADTLAGLLGISVSSLKRYAAGSRATPDDVALRLHFLALVTGDLAGAYNEIGVRRWFERKREQLDGRAPRDFLRGAWRPDAPGPARVRALAQALVSASYV